MFLTIDPPLEIATITYRSGPEWDQRFGRKLRPPSQSSQQSSKSTTESGTARVPALCPDFLIETYLDYQVREPALRYLHLCADNPRQLPGRIVLLEV